MKNPILILIVLLLGIKFSFSQTTYPKITKDSLIVITPIQLKQTNLIFLEHKKLKLEVSELYKQLSAYNEKDAQYRRVLKNKQLQIDSLLSSYDKCQKIILDKNSVIKLQDEKLIRRKRLSFFGIATSVVLVSVILIK